jgi:hypothetical protein
VNFYDEINASISGGTLATIFHSLGNREKVKNSLGFDPLLKESSSGGRKSSAVFKVKNASFLSYSDEFKAWTGPFIMAMVYMMI